MAIKIKSENKKTTKTKTAKKTILIVEDDDFLLSMYKKKLELENFKVVTAVNGESGLRTAVAKCPDLILLDIVLPKMNGFEVLKGLKEVKQLRAVPVILLTNLGQKEDIKKGFKLGANEYLIKAHFLPSEVVAKVRKFI